MSSSDDYPLSAVPEDQRKGLLSTSVVLLGFTFFTATMWAGGNLGTAFSFPELLMVILVGNLLLGAYAAALAYIACRSGLNTVLMGRYCFGEKGSKLSDCLLGFTQIGWYAWGTATIAIALVKMTPLPQWLELPLMVVFGFGFCVTAMVGYRGLDWLSRFAVPAMLLFIGVSLYRGVVDVGGFEALSARAGGGDMGFAAAITVVIGTFVSGGTMATNWSRFARNGRIAVIATLAAFFLGNGLMVLVGAMGTLIYQQADIVDVMITQGFVVLALLMLFLNIWTTQDNTIYNFSVAGCNLLRTDRRRVVTVAGAGIGTLLAVFGMYDLLVPFLILLGTFIPPLGGVIMADFWVRFRGQYPSLEGTVLPAFQWSGLGAYALGALAAWSSPVLPPVVGVGVAFLAHALISRLFPAAEGVPEQS
ncbi:cytosine permease [Alloalcanivorax xenomutans]|jgi:cytosine permease|uniref:cytosine permease n=1 Tax=Alloalcanivorax xenomutans TaxID=1094342 RepID=UPI0003B7E144|nr:cytosine permease [Alloalcanivorax xenomutans]ERS10788.1 cytosine permease [Alcanivorax sp. PN-3]MBA4722670.1 cytosine permease [Alcanivorax sp.]MCE7525051.1 cytosine permease [Alloalcanivorax xenomutans]WOD28685.1 cytosine permease [Alloalcanivorax xenomutans]SOC08400.1 purine-cytosine permease-like protein [Alloalcanivorax xenomutans]